MNRRSLPKQHPQRGTPALLLLLVLRSWNEQHENWTMFQKIRAGRMDQTPRRCPGGASDALPGASYALAKSGVVHVGICRRCTIIPIVPFAMVLRPRCDFTCATIRTR